MNEFWNILASLFEFLGLPSFLLESLPNRIVISFLLLCVAFFICHFCRRAAVVWWKLHSSLRNLQKLYKKIKGTDIVDLDLIGNQAMSTVKMKHLWSEYMETLHPQKALDESGHEQVTCWRATSMAEAFFTEQVLVDTPLRTEFYKHLPGILTGLGIIGTFAGLIQGLTHFEVTNNPDAVRECLRQLIQGVGHAFYISASAIGLAMFFTWLEKSLVTACYRQVEDLCQLIDSFFIAGSGAEYWSRMVQASETSATQSMQLKDALVGDLKQILTEIAAQQVQVSNDNSQKMSENLAQAFAETLQAPMQLISSAVDRASSNQGDAVNKMLTDVLANFSAQMQEMFGGQFRGMADLMTQTNQAMLGTVAKFDQLAENMKDAGQGAATAMADKLHEAMVAVEVRQGAMNKQMQSFVEQMRANSEQSQTEATQKMQLIMTELGDKVSLMVAQLEAQAKLSAGSHENHVAQLTEKMSDFMLGMRDILRESQGQATQKTQESIGQLGEQVAAMVARMDEQSKAATGVHNDSLLQVATRMEEFLASTKEATSEAQKKTADASQSLIEELGRHVQVTVSNLQEMAKISEDASARRQAELAEQAAQILGSLTSQVDSLGRRVTDAAERTNASVTAMATTSMAAIERMNSGTDALLLATGEMAEAEKRVAGTMGAISQSAQALHSSANILSEANLGTQQAFHDFHATAETFATIITELRTIIETARHEASLTNDLVARIQAASEKLATANTEADRYLDGVTKVLGEAHSAFGGSISKILRESNSQFHKELADAVGYLKSAIMDLGDTLDNIHRK